MPASDADLCAALQRVGYDAFRPGQERVIRALLDGRDVLALPPTVAGRSLSYQAEHEVLRPAEGESSRPLGYSFSRCSTSSSNRPSEARIHCSVRSVPSLRSCSSLFV